MNYLSGETLWQEVIDTTASALGCGALQSIPTRCVEHKESLNDTDVAFQIRVVKNLARKSKEMKQRAEQTPTATDFNPFLPYDPALYVGELTDQYRCLLNKFNVMEHHILMVTSHFVTQLEPLNREDFLAAQLCLQARDGLVFYNGGPDAGASITHKHLQMVPLPLSRDTPFPLHDLFSALALHRGELQRSSLPLPHLVTTTAFGGDPRDCAETNWHNYQRMAEQMGMKPDGNQLSPAHNLLMTRNFLWVVPRSCAHYRGLGVNALGFAGTLLVKNEQQLSELETIGCKALLQAVTLR
ncbi:ATP adenylyltransferase family protein [Porticoccus sp.]